MNLELTDQQWLLVCDQRPYFSFVQITFYWDGEKLVWYKKV